MRLDQILNVWRNSVTIYIDKKKGDIPEYGYCTRLREKRKKKAEAINQGTTSFRASKETINVKVVIRPSMARH